MASCYAYLLRTKAPRIVPNSSLSLLLYIPSHQSNSKYILHLNISHYLNCYSLSVQDTAISLGYFHRLLIIFSAPLIFSPSPSDPPAHYIGRFFSKLQIWLHHTCTQNPSTSYWDSKTFQTIQHCMWGPTQAPLCLCHPPYLLTLLLIIFFGHNMSSPISSFFTWNTPPRIFQFSWVLSLNHVWLFVTPWIAAHQASLSITNSRSLLKPRVFT